MSTTAITSASSIQTDYMKLLITQLQNQNPLEPLDNNDMAAQLTQFSQLQQLESMNTNFAKVLESVEHNYASSLIGKEVSFVGETQAGTTDIVSGTVEQVYNNVDGQIVLSAGGYTLSLADVLSVKS
ncbi:MAG: flagellar hook capping FlgD N-terminal domain-containing protein [Phycisphaerae bacterium]|jgi:flagellar basal-body rod modification protein FlgD